MLYRLTAIFFPLMLSPMLVASTDTATKFEAYAKCLQTLKASANMENPKSRDISDQLSTCRTEKKDFIFSHDDRGQRSQVEARIKQLEDEFISAMGKKEAS